MDKRSHRIRRTVDVVGILVGAFFLWVYIGMGPQGFHSGGWMFWTGLFTGVIIVVVSAAELLLTFWHH